MKIKLIVFNKDYIAPERKHYSDTGADVSLMQPITLKPFETLCIPLGFGLNVPEGYNAYIQGRTSISNKGIFVHQCSIDSGYIGEIHMIVTNMSRNTYTFDKGDRLGYIVVHSCAYPDFVTNLGNERGAGWNGSTN